MQNIGIILILRQYSPLSYDTVPSIHAICAPPQKKTVTPKL